MEVKSTYMSLGDYGRAQQYSSIRQLPLYPDTETNKPKKHSDPQGRIMDWELVYLGLKQLLLLLDMQAESKTSY